MLEARARRTSDIGALDGVRGLLALWVLLSHTLPFCDLYVPVLMSGRVAVYTFMLLSGFLMAYHYRRRELAEPWGSPRTWAAFYLRRFFRLAPLYYVLLAVAFHFQAHFMARLYACLATVTPPLTPMHVGELPPGFGVWDLVLHVGFLFGFVPSEASIDILPDWSIGLEMQFYAAFPFLMLLLRRIGAPWFAGLCAGATLSAGFLHFPHPSFLPLALGTFAAGMLIAQAWCDRTQAWSCLALAVLLGLAGAPHLFALVTAAVIAILFLPRRSRWAAVVVNRALGGAFGRFLAERSYSVYLLHMLILIPLADGLAALPWFAVLPSAGRFAVLAPVAVVLTYGAASVTFAVIETPGIALGAILARLVRRRGADNNISTATARSLSA